MRKTLAGVLVVCLGLPISSLAHEASQAPPARATAAGAADATVRQTVAQLGVGKKIRLRTMSGKELRGRITSIGDSTFGLDTTVSGPLISVGEQHAISYADVSAIERQGMNGWLKGGIIAGAIVGGLTAVGAVLGSR